MPRNGSGVMEIEFPDFTPSTTILSSEVDQNNSDIADEITNSLPRDGQAGMNGQFKAADGTASAPAISFTLDTNCGAYRIGTDNVGFAIGGAKVLDLSTTGVGVSIGIAFTADITPSQVTTNQDNYAPIGHGTAFVFRLSSDAARDITGLDGGTNGRVVRFRNVGTFDLVLKDESASSAEANRFALSGDFTLFPDESADLQYDATLSRWTLASTVFNLGGIPIETAPATNDQVLIRDTSAAGARRMTLANTLKVIGSLTEITSVDENADFLVGLDATDGAAKKIKPINLPSGLATIATYTFSVAVAEVIFTSIPATYSALLLVFTGVSGSAASPSFAMTVSTDNGSLFLTTGYRGVMADTIDGILTTSTARFDLARTIAAASSFSGAAVLIGHAGPNTRKLLFSSHGELLTGQSVAADAINALRFFWDSGNIDGGSIVLLGVR